MIKPDITEEAGGLGRQLASFYGRSALFFETNCFKPLAIMLLCYEATTATPRRSSVPGSNDVLPQYLTLGVRGR